MSGIEIPDAAIEAAALAYRDAAPFTRTSPMEAALAVAGPLITAAHLRRIADRVAVILPGSRAAQAVLSAEADRLDPAGSVK